MGYEIAIDERDSIARIRITGQMPNEEHVRARTELVEACRSRQIRRILVDARELQGPRPSTLELFGFGKSWAELARAAPVKIAGVTPQEAGVRSWWRFGETVALNRGLQTAAFEDAAQARAWLLA